MMTNGAKKKETPEKNVCYNSFRNVIKRNIGGSREGVTGVATPPPFQILNIKESNKTKQNIEDNPLEKEKERKSCMFI